MKKFMHTVLAQKPVKLWCALDSECEDGWICEYGVSAAKEEDYLHVDDESGLMIHEKPPCFRKWS